MRRHPAPRIIAAVCHVMGIGFDEALGRYAGELRDTAEPVMARQIIAYMLHRQGWGRPQIAEAMGVLSTASVYDMLQAAERRMREEPLFGVHIERAHLLADVWAEAAPFVHRKGIDGAQSWAMRRDDSTGARAPQLRRPA